MKPQQNKRLHTKHEPTNETTSRVKGRKNAEQHLRPDRQRQHRFHGCRPQPVRLRQSLLHLVQEGFQQVRFLKVFIKRLGCCDEPVQQPRRSHICPSRSQIHLSDSPTSSNFPDNAIAQWRRRIAERIGHCLTERLTVKIRQIDMNQTAHDFVIRIPRLQCVDVREHINQRHPRRARR